ncbi:MAG: ATP synthase F1 subunit gamma [Spirochaetaceae bacterium]|nr:ATP synthase F1 subunit gamma [Spirochaetaceae bacterium]|tara:strand:- start:72869 stop:73792 length:924 start_codon:yes stop_codon:yes gene_type:complete
MAGTKEIKKRISSVKNIKKITHTMEMVAAAKSQRMMKRVQGARPYGEKMEEILAGLEHLAGTVDSPLVERKENPKKYLLVVVTANRGLCGGYNSNVLKLARFRILELQKQGKEVEVQVIGKKGASYFRFIKVPVAHVYTDIDDTFKLDQSQQLGRYLMERFIKEETDVIEVISTVYYNSATQLPEVKQMLPIGQESSTEKPTLHPSGKTKEESAEGKEEGYRQNMIFQPDPETIIEKLLPHLVQTVLYRSLLEAVTAEQIYRRVAMKAANDAAGDMTKSLTQQYNRKRQASITQELAEIVSGADALS